MLLSDTPCRSEDKATYVARNMVLSVCLIPHKE